MKYEKNILDAIEILLNKRLETLRYNFYLDGKIVTDNSDGTYDVEINGDISVLKARTGLSLTVGDIVLVCVINGNTSNRFIDLKRP